MTATKYVELFGLPGSGKTTIARKIDAGNQNHHILRSAYKTAICGKLCAGCPRTILRYAPLEIIEWTGKAVGVYSSRKELEAYNGYIDRAIDLITQYTDDDARKATVIRWIRETAIRYGAVRRNLTEGGIVFGDEGFLQRGNAIFCPPSPTSEIEKTAVESYISAIPEVDHVILLDISIDNAIERFEGRTEGPPRSFSGHDRLEQRRRLERMKGYTDVAAMSLEDLGIPYTRIENDKLPDETKRHIEQVIKRL